MMKFSIVLLIAIYANIASAQNENIPDKEDWLIVSQEPAPLADIQSLVVYPEEARKSGLEGSVKLTALLGEDGTVLRVDVEKASHDIFIKPSVDAMKAIRFRPAMNGDTPLKVWYGHTINFNPTLHPTKLAQTIGEIPRLSRDPGLEGIDSIVIRLAIGKDAKVMRATVVDPAKLVLHDRHRRTLEKLRFSPAERDGVPIESTLYLTIPVED